MKRNYTVVFIDTIERAYFVEDANSPEEAENIAEGYHEAAYGEESDFLGECEILDSQIIDVIPTEKEEETL